jgi:hypothetical protein
MAKKPATLSVDEHVKLIVTEALKDPMPFIKWSEGLEPAEKVGRIKRAKMSALYYCLHHFILRRVTDNDTFAPPDVKVYVATDDQSTLVRIKRTIGEEIAITVLHPEWLYDFFDDEEHFELLFPDDTTPLMEVLQLLYEFCLQNGHISAEDV